MARTILIGDIHGCIDEFGQLLKVADYTKEDRLILLGDLLDRGPNSAEVVRFARAINAECVMGNHEEKALRWRAHEKKRAADPNYKNPMKTQNPERLAQWAQIPEEDWEWLANLPFYLRINESWVALHAGVLPNKEVEYQDKNHLLRLRYVDNTTGKMVPIGGPNEPQNSTFWAEKWNGSDSIVFGHYTFDEVYYRAERRETKYGDKLVRTIGIDTGCYGGNYLTAIAVEGDHVVGDWQVKAAKEYAPRKLDWGTND
jgi:bis(5'-nucleosyl)-tetraphosphatase (symmetrical)